MRERNYDFGNISGTLVYKSDNIGDTIKSLGGEENQENIKTAVIALIKYTQVYDLIEENRGADFLKTLDQETTGVLLDAVNGKLEASIVKGVLRPELKKSVGPGAYSVGRFYKTNSEIDENGYIIPFNTFHGYVGPSVETLIIPEGVEYVQRGSLVNGNMDAVKEVVFPKTLKEVESFANQLTIDWSANKYKYPEKLEKLVFLGDVEKVDKYAFAFSSKEETSRLKEVIFEGKVKSIEEGAFMGTGIEIIEFSKGVDKIKQNAFRNCKSLKEISIPKAKRIWTYAFSGCTALESVTVPEKCKIDENAFMLCEALANENGEIYVNGVQPKNS